MLHATARPPQQDAAATGPPQPSPPPRVPELRTQLALSPADQAIPRRRTVLHWASALAIAAIPVVLLAVELSGR